MGSNSLLDGVALLRPDPQKDDPVRDLFRERFFAITRPLMEVRSARQLRAAVKRAVLDYVPLRTWMNAKLVSEFQERGQTLQSMVSDINDAMWEAFDARARPVFQPTDRKILLEVLRGQMDTIQLHEEAPKDNHPALLSALLDAYWDLVRLDLCLSVVALIATGDLRPSHERTAHWLCLLAYEAQSRWRSALFANDPVLRQRLTTPGKTITTEELERRLGV